MGLDQRLMVIEYVSNWAHKTAAEKARYEALTDLLGYQASPDSPGIYVNVPVIYWRKAYFIQDYFSRTLGDLINGHETQVDRETLGELLELLDDTIDNPENAATNFPSGDWGSATDAAWFYGEVKRTYAELRKILEAPGFENKDFYYESDW